MPITRRGKANIAGVTSAFDIIVYPVQQKLKAGQVFEEEIVKGVQGDDAAWLARNEHLTLGIGVKFLADTAAHAAVPISTGAGILSTAGQPFMAPYATVTISTCDFAGLNGVWQNVSGTDLDMENTKVADGDYKLRRYADSTQNTAANTAPS